MVFKKKEPNLWISFGTLERRKLSDIDDITNFAYDSVQREQITHDSYAVILKPKARVLQHVPVGYHLRITYSENGWYSRERNCALLLIICYLHLFIRPKRSYSKFHTCTNHLPASKLFDQFKLRAIANQAL